MKVMVRFSDRYKPCVYFALASAMLLGPLSSLVSDQGECITSYLYSLAVYVGLLVMVLFRRPSAPTKLDLIVIKWGLVLLFLLGLAIYPFAWYLRGLR